MDANEREADVVIVGGGPVGMGLAIELGQRDLAVVVVERHPQPQPIPKGQNLTQRTMEHFHFWGVEAEIRKAVPIPAERGIGGLTAYGSLLSDYHYDWYQRVSVRPFYFTDNERLPQYATEEVLRRRVAELPSVEVLYGWSAEDVRQEREGASADIVEPESGERKRLRGRGATAAARSCAAASASPRRRQITTPIWCCWCSGRGR
jgi:4-hydroxyisophthalate hydroxylase